jgi:hypothetical protein
LPNARCVLDQLAALHSRFASVLRCTDGPLAHGAALVAKGFFQILISHCPKFLSSVLISVAVLKTIESNPAPMFRAAAVALVALAAFDYFYCNGWYTHAAEAVTLNALRLITG